jgi:tetratricopeptide (TPR) repeat protein
VAQVAAVIGVRFDQGLLAAIVDAPSGFAAQLAELRDAGLIVPDPDKASSYLFAHAITRDVVYAGILYAQRRVLHLHVATHIAARATAAPASQAALLGHHYRLAEAWAQALPHLWLAAQQAHQRHANDEALALYRDACAALEQLAEPPIEALHGIYTELGDVLTLVGDYDAARVSYERLLQQLPQDANSSCERAQLHCKIGAGYTQQGQPKEALLWLERGYALLDDETGERCLLERARLCSEIGWAHFTQMRYNVARSWLEQALALLQLTSAHDESARLYNRLGGLAWSQGSLEEAQIYVEYSLQLCEQNGDIAGQALALNNLGLLADTRGDWDAATRWYSLAFQRNEMLGDRRGQAVVAHNLGVLKAYQQLYHQALVYLHDAVRLSEAVGDLFHLMRSRRELGRVLLNWGRYEAARPYLEQALEQAVALELPLEQLDSHAALGVLALECGKLEQAREQAAVGAPLLHAHNNDSSETGRFGRFLALLAWHEGDDARAAALLGEAAALFERIADRPEALVTYRLLAQLNSGPFVADEC